MDLHSVALVLQYLDPIQVLKCKRVSRVFRDTLYSKFLYQLRLAKYSSYQQLMLQKRFPDWMDLAQREYFLEHYQDQIKPNCDLGLIFLQKLSQEVFLDDAIKLNRKTFLLRCVHDGYYYTFRRFFDPTKDLNDILMEAILLSKDQRFLELVADCRFNVYQLKQTYRSFICLIPSAYRYLTERLTLTKLVTFDRVLRDSVDFIDYLKGLPIQLNRPALRAAIAAYEYYSEGSLRNYRGKIAWFFIAELERYSPRLANEFFEKHLQDFRLQVPPIKFALQTRLPKLAEYFRQHQGKEMLLIPSYRNQWRDYYFR